MPKRKKKSEPQSEIIFLELTDYRARVDASINYEVRDPRHYYSDAKVYDFKTNLEIEGISTYPDERIGEKYHMTIYVPDSGFRDIESTLADCHVCDENGTHKYRKVRGKQVAVYDIPKGIGHLDRQRGTRDWSGAAWVSNQTVTDMLILLANVRPLFIAIHEFRIERTHWIVGLTLQTNNPDEE